MTESETHMVPVAPFYFQGNAFCGNHGVMLRMLLLPSEHQKTIQLYLPAAVVGERSQYGDLQCGTGKNV